jgi:hypothetical protein
MMSRIRQQSDRLHGMLFDGLVFAGNLAVINWLPALGEDALDQSAGAWLLVAVAAQLAGAWWKSCYLGSRLARRHPPLPQSGLGRKFMNGLLFLNFILFTVVTLLGVYLVGIYDDGISGQFWRGDIWVIIALLIGAFVALSVSAAEQPAPEVATEIAYSGWGEYGADALLWLSVLIVTRVFWGGLLVEIAPSQGRGWSTTSLVLLVSLSILFTVFYLPARYLFLAEDYPYPRTWLQAWAAMLPVVWFVLWP